MLELHGSKRTWILNQVSDTFRAQMTEEGMRYYAENLAHHEEDGWSALATMPKQKMVEDREVWPDLDQLRQRPDCRFLEEKLGIFRRAAARLNDNRCWIDGVAFQFNASIDVIPRTSLESAKLILPHLAKAVEVGRSFFHLKAKYKAVLTALDHVQIGICIALQRGNVIVANREADRIFSTDDGIRMGQDKRLMCRHADAHSRLQHAIELAAQTAQGKKQVPETLLTVPKMSGRRPFLIEVAPLRDSADELTRDLEGAVVTVIDPDNPQPFSTKRITEAYGLTRAEAEVCRHLVDGWTNEQIAEDRRVRVDTVKTQIASIFQRTATKRRSELIRLVLKSSPPDCRSGRRSLTLH